MQTVTASSFHLHKARLLGPSMDSLPEQFEVVVVGTGLVESMVAAACARAGHSILHLDTSSYYGGDWAAFTWDGLQGWLRDQEVEQVVEGKEGEPEVQLETGEQVVQLSQLKTVLNLKEAWHRIDSHDSGKDSGEPTQQDDVTPGPVEPRSGSEDPAVVEQWTKVKVESHSRKFNLDLTPRLLFSRGSMVELLISSNISRYTEFKSVTRVLTLLQGQLEQVPSSRADVFNTRHITVVQKRILMKFLTYCLSPEIDEIAETDQRTFMEFLRYHNLTDNLVHFVVHAIAMVDPACSLTTGLAETKKFLTSLGRFGPTPFLWSMYGTGELPQAFCRLCAVYGGVYYLGRSLGGIVTSGTKAAGIVIEGGKKVTCNQLVLPLSKVPESLKAEEEKPVVTSRSIFLTTRSVLPTEKEQLTFISLPHSPHPIHLVEVGVGAAACPKGLHVLHASTQGGETDLRRELESLVGDTCLYSLTFEQIGGEGVATKLDNVFMAPGPGAELDFDLAIGQAKQLYENMFPGEEFLPRAPDPEEILLGGEDADGVGDMPEDETIAKESAEKGEEIDERTGEANPTEAS